MQRTQCTNKNSKRSRKQYRRGIIQRVLPISRDREKRTTPYHPKTDRIAERNIGMIKQVIRCLQLDRRLPKGSWPSLLTEASFHRNGMTNGTSSVSPHMLVRGQQPRSPMDSWYDTLKEGGTNSYEEYLSSLKLKQETLRQIAQENAVEI
ncbi:hypothetical protein LOD99_5462 [Oopsacas minuta]|uniref:Uncharacterized protein n=1 Tax=Oopsacas minuta TaxID=111878 RepID=A0AAV7JQI2_9METZ|nr:hypothetical protein LOD99_5462 [Oopsacas minuta]